MRGLYEEARRKYEAENPGWVPSAKLAEAPPPPWHARPRVRAGMGAALAVAALTVATVVVVRTQLPSGNVPNGVLR